MGVVFAERTLRTYRAIDGSIFRISEIDGTLGAQAHELIIAAGGIRDLLASSWRAKFVPHILSESDLQTKIPGAEAQAARVAQPTRQARYLIASTGEVEELSPQILAFARVETYQPRNRLRSSYPNITDLETLDGGVGVGKPYHRHAAALLLHALEGYPENRKVSAYTEAPNQDGIDFYENYGLERDAKMSADSLTEQIGSSSLTYVHMAGASIAVVREKLLESEEFLA